MPTDFWPKTTSEEAEMERRRKTCLHLWQRAHLFGYPANYNYCAICGATDRNLQAALGRENTTRGEEA